jgi:hypothetical protein
MASLLTGAWDWAEAADADRLTKNAPAKADAQAIFLMNMEYSSVSGAETGQTNQTDREKIPPACWILSQHHGSVYRR